MLLGQVAHLALGVVLAGIPGFKISAPSGWRYPPLEARREPCRESLPLVADSIFDPAGAERVAVLLLDVAGRRAGLFVLRVQGHATWDAEFVDEYPAEDLAWLGVELRATDRLVVLCGPGQAWRFYCWSEDQQAFEVEN